MKQRTYIFIVPILLFVSFLGFNLGAERFLSGISIDLTQDRIFTLSPATKKTITETQDKIYFDFYYSKHAANDNPPLRIYGQRVRDVLKSYARLSNGKIIFREHDVSPFSAAEDNAIAANLTPWRDNLSAVAPIYIGLVASRANQNPITIRAFVPEKEASLEYDITRIISDINNPKNRIIGVISDIDWFMESGPSGLRTIPNSQIAKEISAEFEVVMLAKDFDRLPQKMDALIIAQPFDLSEFQQYLIDQYAVDGGKILLAQDPASSISFDNKIGRVSSINSLGPLSTNWGFVLSGAIVADKKNALLVQSKLGTRDAYIPQPLYFSINNSGLNLEHLVTANLSRGVNFATPGQIIEKPISGVTFEPLLTTSQESMLVDKETALNSPTPQEIASIWQSDGKGQIIAASINGFIKSAFPNGAPVQAPRNQINRQIFGAPLPLDKHKNISNKKANIIIVSDVDFLSDGLFLQTDTANADNANFVMNAIDSLSGDAELAQLRSKVRTSRALDKVELMGKLTQSNALENQTRLESQLRDLQSQLQDIEDLPQIDSDFEKTKLRKEIAQTRSQLRSLVSSRLEGIAHLKILIIFICAIFIPLFILLLGFYFNRKSYQISYLPRQF